ncbi:hypothetical protein PAHAL_6G091300 [Panicum hallii]|uniref:Uncharacterized protein n=1 Tax=Panicum hallii TaxID=206008 RepID=A0A2T8IFR5_9POAL|nr:hypothetical protein PAHAL_6G091300 [Panicum hallii]
MNICILEIDSSRYNVLGQGKHSSIIIRGALPSRFIKKVAMNYLALQCNYLSTFGIYFYLQLYSYFFI